MRPPLCRRKHLAPGYDLADVVRCGEIVCGTIARHLAIFAFSLIGRYGFISAKIIIKPPPFVPSILTYASSHIYRALQTAAGGKPVVGGAGLRPGVSVQSIYVDEVQVRPYPPCSRRYLRSRHTDWPRQWLCELEALLHALPGMRVIV